MDELNYKFSRFMFRLGSDKRKRLYRKLSKLLGNGVPILDALVSLYNPLVEAKRTKEGIAIALNEWMQKIRNGKKLSQAVEGWVDNDEMMLIAAGEASGNLDSSLASVAEIMDAKQKIRKAVIGGLTYPAIMMMIVLGVLIMFSFKIIPEFSRVVPADSWHGVARVMINIADFCRQWLIAILFVLVSLICAFFYSLPRWTDGLRIKLDLYLPYSLYRIVLGSTWMIGFAALVGAGMRTELALQQLAASSSPWMQTRINACLRGMRSGANPGEALRKSGYGFPDREIIDDLAVYSKLSGFDVALSIIGREWITESVEKIQSLMKVVFSLSVALVGFSIAFLAGGLVGMELQMAAIMQGTYH